MTDSLSNFETYEVCINNASESVVNNEVYMITTGGKQKHCGTFPDRFTLMNSLVARQDKVKRKRRSPKVPWRKPEGMPKRPLSAYNLFFQCERERLLNIAQGRHDANDGKQNKRTKSGIGFAGLAQQIASKWKSVDVQTKSYFQARASEEKERYKKEIEAWKKERATAKQPKDLEEKQEAKKVKKKPKSVPLKEENNKATIAENKDLPLRSPSPFSSAPTMKQIFLSSTSVKLDEESQSVDRDTDLLSLTEMGQIAEVNPTPPTKRHNSDSLLELQSAVYKCTSYAHEKIDIHFQEEMEFKKNDNNSSMSSSLMTLAESLDDESFQFLAALNQPE